MTAETGVRETRSDRLAWARRAGLGRISAIGAVAGVLVAYGAFAVLVGVATAVVATLGLDIDLTDRKWRRAGAGAGIAAGVLLFFAYLFAGYVSGRMARRSGLVNGLVVFVGGLWVATATVAAVKATGASDAALDRLREGLVSFGVPVSGRQWDAVGTVAGIAALVGMLLGAVLGGVLGERWHAKVERAALDAEVRAASRGHHFEERLHHDRTEAGASAESQSDSVVAHGDATTPGERPTSPSSDTHREATQSGDDIATQSGDDITDLTKAELYQRAQDADVKGRSQMTKDELVDALDPVEPPTASTRDSTP